ncbi:recombinase RecT [Herbaspirillum sp. YR522]|uniref:recombinase RecT n=1 Tax=Herbaspirillum sp. YR522 TaxID=1144342 RepID=UPI00026FA295|nr:recombinase RecT [Herbaspirillum sp. YR522]EJN06455.1 recombinase, phage RecT family [Herbaspirillum sp. YR522]
MNQVALSPAGTLNQFLKQHKNQIEMALPKHITPDRMMRLTLTAFSQNRSLQDCTPQSIFASVIVASQLGLEIGVGGQGYLVPYKGTCTFVPGWQGLVDLVSRAGRATVWTGAVYRGDKFDWALGDRPFVKHQPEGDGDDWHDITHVYAIGRVNGSDHPVIEVWTMDRIVRHLNKFNKVGGKHYALTNNGQNMEMYARKVALLQVLKYMPKSVEVMRAMDVANAVDSGKNFTFDGDVVVIDDRDIDESPGDSSPGATGVQQQSGGRPEIPECTDEEFKAKTPRWRKQLLEDGVSEADLVKMIETRTKLTEDQKTTINSWTHEND